MNSAYPDFDIVNDNNRDLFQGWDLEDPISPEECLRTRIIAEKQGNENPILQPHCQHIEEEDLSNGSS